MKSASQIIVERIQDLYKTGKYTVEQIAEAYGIPVESVALVVATQDGNQSALAKTVAGEEVEEDMTPAGIRRQMSKHVKTAIRVIGELAEDYENPTIQFSSSKLILQVGLGDIGPQISGEQDVVKVFNNIVKKGIEAAQHYDTRCEKAIGEGKFRPVNSPEQHEGYEVKV